MKRKNGSERRLPEIYYSPDSKFDIQKIVSRAKGLERGRSEIVYRGIPGEDYRKMISDIVSALENKNVSFADVRTCRRKELDGLCIIVER